jgi:peroxiredoxin
MANKNSLLKVGDNAPDSEVFATTGERVHLSDYWKKQPVVIVFLRHFGCTFCRQHVAMLRRDYAQFLEAGGEILCVGMGGYKVGRGFEILMDTKFPTLVTGETNLPYQQYGLGKGTVGQIFGIRSFVKGLKATFQGHVGTSVQGDPYQMPGVFIVDTSGTIRYAHYYDDIADTPENSDLVSIVKTLHVALATAP